MIKNSEPVTICHKRFEQSQSTLSVSLTMKAISTDKANVISLLLSGYSIRKVESITGLGNSTVSRIYQELEMDKENYKGGKDWQFNHRGNNRVQGSMLYSVQHQNSDPRFPMTQAPSKNLPPSIPPSHNLSFHFWNSVSRPCPTPPCSVSLSSYPDRGVVIPPQA